MSDPTVVIHVARYGTYDSEGVDNRLAFPSREGAFRWVDQTHTVLHGDAEWTWTDKRTERCEDNIGNWAEIEEVRISNPVQLFRDTGMR